MKNKIRENKLNLIILALSLVIFIVASIAASTNEESMEASEYSEYEKAKVISVMADNTWIDEDADGATRGEQLLIVEVRSGQYKGEQMLASNYTGPLYGVALGEGDGCVLVISTYKDGSTNATVYEYNRELPLLICIVVFMLLVLLIGKKTGLKSLVSLAITLVVVFKILLPMLLKGYPTIPTVFIGCVYIIIVSFVILEGVTTKTICAMLGTSLGVLLSSIFGFISQSFVRVNGLRMSDVEPLLQIRQSGTPVGLKNLLVAGIMVSALGAVMDVAMSISSSMCEIKKANETLSSKALFNSGMNIGRDLVGTMTNTLILAILGSSFTLMMYLSSIGLSFHQLFSSAYLSIEVISSISSSMGLILAIPATALVSSTLLGKIKNRRQNK